MKNFWENIQFDANGLMPAIAQDVHTGEILMLAWANREAIETSVNTGFATYWSRSRQKLWKKGEESGHRQKIHAMRLDCDGDALLYVVEQQGGIACHTGRKSCFYRRAESPTNGELTWEIDSDVLKNPKQIYKK